MGFDNNWYPNRKDHRKQFVKTAERCCKGCRSHGSCSRCLSDRLIRAKREKARTDVDLQEYKKTG